MPKSLVRSEELSVFDGSKPHGILCNQSYDIDYFFTIFRLGAQRINDSTWFNFCILLAIVMFFYFIIFFFWFLMPFTNC
jgi:hypothetical protein